MTPSQRRIRKNRVGARRRRRRRIIILIFALLFVLCIFLVMRAVVSLPYASVDLTTLAKAEFAGFDHEGYATVTTDDAAVDELLATVKSEYDDAWFHTSTVEDADYATFRQSLEFSTTGTAGLSNGDTINIIATCDRELADKLKIDITNTSGETVVQGLQSVTKLTKEEVFADLDVSFTGISPSLEIALRNNSTHPFIQKIFFEIIDPKEYYASGDIVRIRANYTDELSIETGYVVDTPAQDCIREYTASSDTEYVRRAADLPGEIIKKAIEAGKGAFKDANEYGVRIFCEANLVPVYINKQATFTYGSPKFVSAYFKTVLPEKAGELGMSYNDLDIIYEVSISQADGKACTAYAAVRFSDIIKNGDGSYSYDFSSPSVMSESHYSARVKKNVVDPYYDSHEIEKVSP